MKAYGGVDVQIHVNLNSELDGVERLASRPARFTPKENVRGRHWIWGWVGRRFGLDDVEEKNLALTVYSKPDTSTFQSVS
jgi:hypothetical protein